MIAYGVHVVSANTTHALVGTGIPQQETLPDTVFFDGSDEITHPGTIDEKSYTMAICDPGEPVNESRIFMPMSIWYNVRPCEFPG